MRPLALFTLLALTVAFAACGSAPRQAPAASGKKPYAPPPPGIDFDPRRYVCYRAPGPLVLDGKLDEAGWKAAPFTWDFVDILGEGAPPPRYRTRVKMLWDDTHFHFGAVMEEPHVWAKLKKRDSVIFHDNDFEIFLDPDGDTHDYFELEVNAFATEWDLFLVKPYRDGGPALHQWDMPGLKTAVLVDGTLNDPTDTDRGWSVEISIPWAALKQGAGTPAPPKPGHRWRVNFSRVQWRTVVRDGRYEKVKGQPEDNWVWSPQGVVNMHYPEMWGFVQFAGTVAGGGAEAAQRDPDEDALWLLRRLYYRQRRAWADTGRFTTDVRALGAAGTDLRVHLTPGFWQASVATEGGRVHIQADGRTWRTGAR